MAQLLGHSCEGCSRPYDVFAEDAPVLRNSYHHGDRLSTDPWRPDIAPGGQAYACVDWARRCFRNWGPLNGKHALARALRFARDQRRAGARRRLQQELIEIISRQKETPRKIGVTA